MNYMKISWSNAIWKVFYCCWPHCKLLSITLTFDPFVLKGLLFSTEAHSLYHSVVANVTDIQNPFWKVNKMKVVVVRLSNWWVWFLYKKKRLWLRALFSQSVTCNSAEQGRLFPVTMFRFSEVSQTFLWMRHSFHTPLEMGQMAFWEGPALKSVCFHRTDYLEQLHHHAREDAITCVEPCFLSSRTSLISLWAVVLQTPARFPWKSKRGVMASIVKEEKNK